MLREVGVRGVHADDRHAGDEEGQHVAELQRSS